MSGVTAVDHSARSLNRIRISAAANGLAGVVGFGFVVAMAADKGAYHPTAWGWSALAFLWLAAIALVVGEARLGALDLATIGAFLAVFAWVLASALWSASVTRTFLEAERALVYPAALAALLLLVRRGAERALLAGTWAGITAVCLYSLATRLFPERLGLLDPVAGYRLSQPIGYWNSLGLFAAMGVLLAVGLASRAGHVVLRALASGSLVVLVPTLYFTFSRGAWVALALGMLAVVALDPRRLQLISTILVAAPLTAAALTFAYRSHALSRVQPRLSEASSAGHRLAVILACLAVANALLVGALNSFERRWRPSPTTHRVYGAVLVLACAAALVTIFVRYGDPATLSRRGYDAFAARPPRVQNSLNRRLFNLSGSGRILQWRVAWAEVKARPFLGSGAGTYELAWLERRPLVGQVRDAHNLYLETLAELGPVGLLLLLAALALPCVAAFRARGQPLVPAALGSYVAYLVHSAVDWDWEIPAVTLVALVCAAAVLVGARNVGIERAAFSRARRIGLAFAIALGAFALVGLLGNSKLASARAAADRGSWGSAEKRARSAARWAPWSAEPWELRGLAAVGQGRLADARQRFRVAINKDPQDWLLWFELAQASQGQARRVALTHAARLNPRSPEVASYAAAAGVGRFGK
jgi:tetratricopeptide (TPR) repeat protein